MNSPSKKGGLKKEGTKSPVKATGSPGKSASDLKPAAKNLKCKKMIICESVTATKQKNLPQCTALHYQPAAQSASEAYLSVYQGGNEIPVKEFPSFHLINQTPQIIALCTLIRNKNTSRSDFVFFSDRLFRLLVEEALAYFPFAKWTVETPTGSTFNGLKFMSKICGVSIMRAGESMEKALRECIPNVRIGKILVQRLEDGSAKPQHFYTKYPLDIADRMVILMDPMLATGGSVLMAIESLLQAGVRRENIVFINMVAAPEGVKALCTAYPEIRTVSCVLDSHLNEQKYIIPGLGDFGDRYFGTC